MRKPKETDWIVGDGHNQVVHRAAKKRDCLEWIAAHNQMRAVPRGHELFEGVYQATAIDVLYLVMDSAERARAQGFSVPAPGTSAYGLDDGTSALMVLEDGPAFVWCRKGHERRLPAPVGLDDFALDKWAECTARRLADHGVVYVGRREPVTGP